MLYGTANMRGFAGYGEDVAEQSFACADVDEFRRGRIPIETAQTAVDGVKTRLGFTCVPTAEDSEIGRWNDMDFDPAPIFANVRVPTLLFYGEDDEWSRSTHVAAWERAAERANNTDVLVRRLPGTGHLPTKGGAQTVEAIRPSTSARSSNGSPGHARGAHGRRDSRTVIAR